MKLIIQPEAGTQPLVQAVRRARKTIDVAIFRLDRAEFEKALGAAVVRGVRVRALIAHTNRGGERGLRKLEQRLLGLGVNVSRTNDDLARYHGKFMVVDDTLHVFGFNFTKLDIEKSRSFGVSTRDRKAVQEALKLFESDCTRQDYSPGRSNLVVSPQNSREMLLAFLKGARKQIAIYDARVEDRAVIRLLQQQVRAGVEVRIIGAVKAAGVQDIAVRPMTGPRLHVRAIVRDSSRAFVGSQSLRPLELNRRREVGLIINNSIVARAILATFDADWRSAGVAVKGEGQGESGAGLDKESAPVPETAHVA